MEEAQTKELSKLNVGVAAVMQKGWMTPVLMKVGRWNPQKYEAPLQYENIGTVQFVRSCLAKEMFRQIQDNKFVVKPLGDIIRRSNLDMDRKAELSEITDMYRIYKNQSLRPTKGMLGTLFFEIIGCEGLFNIIPMNGLYSDQELDVILSSMDEKAQAELYENIVYQASNWIKMFEQAMSQYISVEPEVSRCALTYMLGVKGEFGDEVDNVFAQLYNLLIWDIIS